MNNRHIAILVFLWLVLLAAGCRALGGIGTESVDGGLLLSYERQGGIAGFCDTVVVYDNGTALISSCRRDDTAVQLSAAQQSSLDDWEQDYQRFEISEGEEDIPDGMLEVIVFYGRGDTLPAAGELATMRRFVQDLLRQASEGN